MAEELSGDEWLDRRLAELAEQGIKSKRQAKQEAAKPVTPDSSKYADLVPDISTPKSSADLQMDQILDRLDILQAYQRWVTKAKPVVRRGQKENIMVSCPNPKHIDKRPSVAINTEKQVYDCYACVEGGDKYDIAAYGLGFPVPGYKTGENGKMFRDLRQKMVESLGYRIQPAPSPSLPVTVYLPELYGGKEIPPPEYPDQTEYEQAVADAAGTAAVEPVAPVAPPVPAVVPETEEKVEPEVDISDINLPTLDWQDIVTPGTFLDDYMKACTIDDAAEEYHFWCAMLGIGLAVGRDITLFDTKPILANLLVCILGQTGERKTRALGHLRDLIGSALPFDYNTGLSTGIKVIQSVASGEQLIEEYDQKIPDPTNPKLKIPGYPVRGLTLYGELSDLIGRAQRQGSVIKGTIMDFADNQKDISSSSVTGGQRRAVDAFFSAATTTQPESLKDLLKEGDSTSGFLNRWLFASGKPKKKIAIGGARVDMSTCVMSLQRIHGQIKREIQWSEDAEKLFTAHFDRAINPIQKTNPILGRLDLLEKKLILILAINENLSEIDIDIVHKVILMHAYLVSTYNITSDSMAFETENNKIYNDILRTIQELSSKTLHGPTERNIKDRLVRRKYDMMKLSAIFKKIAEEETRVEVTLGDPNKPGRKTPHYKWVG